MAWTELIDDLEPGWLLNRRRTKWERWRTIGPGYS